MNIRVKAELVLAKNIQVMEFGIGMFGDNHYDASGKPQDAGTRIRELITEIKRMDEVGVDFFGLGEHHRSDYAVSVPETVLAGAATVTNRIKLGSAVSVLSSTDPVRLFQDFATLDQLSRGRAEIFAGRGSFIESFPLYGYDLQHYDELFEEKLELLLKINQSNPVTWKGNFRAALNNQEIFPRPYNKQLPVWVAVGGTPASVQRAAKLGLPVMFAIIGGNPAQFKPLFDYYQELYLQHGHAPEDFKVGVHMHAFFGKNAAQVAEAYYPVYAAQMNRIGATRGWPKYQRMQFDAGRGKHGHLIITDATEAIERIQAFIELFGLTRFSAHMDVGGPAHNLLLESIEVYGTHIVPGLKKQIQ